MITKDFDLDNIFTMSDIIDKMGLEADVSNISKQIQTSKLENKKDATKLGKEVAISLGIELITKILRNLHKARNEIKELIASLTESTPELVGKFSLKQTKEFFTELVQREGFFDFLEQAEASTEKK